MTDTSFKGNKRSLPVKPCARCGRSMSWRKAWERCWHEVRYCSERCRRSRAPASTLTADATPTGPGRP